MSKAPFIPAWLDDAGLSAAEMRTYIHLCRSADNNTGIAWPSYARMTSITGLGKSTVRRCIESLEKKGMIRSMGKPFGGSCRYRIATIVPPEGQLCVSNSSTTGTNDGQSIVPPQDRNSPLDGTSIVPPEGQEGSPSKVPQVRVSNNSPSKRKSRDQELSDDQTKFANWFKDTLPKDQQDHLPANWLRVFGKAHDELVRLDKRSPDEIRAICQWARTDSFWTNHFRSPAKLRKRDPQGTLYYDVFAERMKAEASRKDGTHHGNQTSANKPAPKTLDLSRRIYSQPTTLS